MLRRAALAGLVLLTLAGCRDDYYNDINRAAPPAPAPVTTSGPADLKGIGSMCDQHGNRVYRDFNGFHEESLAVVGHDPTCQQVPR